MSSQKRSEIVREAELAFAQTLKECREKIAAHAETGPEDGAVPRTVYHLAWDILEELDEAIERIVTDRDQDIEDGIEDIERR
jgi:hypothetical protein